MGQEFGLPTGYFGALRLLAFKEGRKAQDILVEALDEYFAKHGINASEMVREAAWPPSSDGTRERLRKALKNIPKMPMPEYTPDEIEEIEREIDETVREVRTEMWERRNAASV